MEVAVLRRVRAVEAEDTARVVADHLLLDRLRRVEVIRVAVLPAEVILAAVPQAATVPMAPLHTFPVVQAGTSLPRMAKAGVSRVTVSSAPEGLQFRRRHRPIPRGLAGLTSGAGLSLWITKPVGT